MPAVTPGAIVPFIPYPKPVPPPVLGTGMLTATFDQAWLPYILGCCKALTCNATFDPPDPGPALAAVKAAYDLLNQLSAATPVVDTSHVSGPCSDCGDCCMSVRWNGCVLEQYDCTSQTWVPVPTIGAPCATNPAPGNGATQPPPGGGTSSNCFTAQADVTTPLPWRVNSGDTLDFTTILGAGSDDGLSWYCVDGQIYYLGACAGGGHTSSSDPLNTTKHMALLLKIGSNYYPLTSSVFTVPSGVSNVVPYVQVNAPTIANCRGSYNLCVTYTNNAAAPVVPGEQTLDFTTNDHGFYTLPDTGGSRTAVWVPGAGWANSSDYPTCTHYNFEAGGQFNHATLITRLRFYYNFGGAAIGTGYVVMGTHPGDTSLYSTSFTPTDTGNQVWDSGAISISVPVGGALGFDFPDNCYAQGTAVLSAIVIDYDGVAPF